MKRGALIASILLMAACKPAMPPGPPKALTAEPGPGECTVRLEIAGMMCDSGCGNTVYRAIEAVEGVVEVAVDSDRGLAMVLAAKKLCVGEANAIVKAVSSAGFQATTLPRKRHR